MATIDLSDTIQTKSDQLNAVDLLGGEVTVQITAVKKVEGDKKQPTILEISGGFKPYKPCLNMRRILVKAWGMDGAAYVGRSMTLFRDPDVIYANESVGGIRIKALSDIPEKFDLRLIESKRLPKIYHVAPIGPAATQPKQTKAEPPATDAKLLAEFADLCAALTNAKTQPDYDTCLAECTRLKPSLDKKSLTTLTGLVNAAKARIAAPAQSEFDVFRGIIAKTDVTVTLMNAIMDDVAKAVGEKRLTEAESVELNRIADERMAVL